MNDNILIFSGSPQMKKGNSESIVDYLVEGLRKKNINSTKLCLNKEIRREDNSLTEAVNEADIIILSLPIYENSVPSLILKFFEKIYKEKGKLLKKTRKFLIITNSGFPEVEANWCAIKTCRLFARDMNFIWLGGIAAAPGTLIDGKELEKVAKSYKRLITSLNIIVDAISKGSDIPETAFKIMRKSFINPFLYRFAGRIIQKPIIKRIGKDKFLSRPLDENRLINNNL